MKRKQDGSCPHGKNNAVNSGVPPVFLREHLLFLLMSLEGVRQNSCYHPEEDALYHSLQVFQLAHQASSDPELWAAALLHDIGKAANGKEHAKTGADDLDGLLSPRIVWLVRNHLNLLATPRRTRRLLRNTALLQDLELLRTWDLAGRRPDVCVMRPEEAVDILMAHYAALQPEGRGRRALAMCGL
ncbi:MAG: HD domain-containing protein [Gammaproteobacteria bacterium]|nr:HD domain-containing protein [Gammaproteobacteria bacterium]